MGNKGAPNPDYDITQWTTGDLIDEQKLHKIQSQIDQITEGIGSLIEIGTNTTAPASPYNQIWITQQYDENDNFGGNDYSLISQNEFNSLLNLVANSYTPGNSYSVGDYVIYYIQNSIGEKEYTLYKCIRNITNAPAQLNRENWEEQFVIGNLIKELNENLNSQAAARIQNDNRIMSNLSSQFSSSQVYNLGDCVTYDGNLYIYNNPISSNGQWNPSNWTQYTVAGKTNSLYTKISNQISTKNGERISNIQQLLSIFAPEYNQNKYYNQGDYVTYNLKLYKCNTDNAHGSFNNNINKWDQVLITGTQDDTTILNQIYSLISSNVETINETMSDNVNTLNNSINTLKNVILNIISVDYDSVQSIDSKFAKGNIVKHDNNLYQCTQDFVLTGDWSIDSAYFTEITINKKLFEIFLNKKTFSSLFKKLMEIQVGTFNYGFYYTVTNSSDSKYINNVNVPKPSNIFVCSVLPCSPGDKFYLKGSRKEGNGTIICTWAVLNSDGRAIERSKSSGIVETTVTINSSYTAYNAQQSPAYIVVNNDLTQNPNDFYLYKYNPDSIKDIKNIIVSNFSSSTGYESGEYTSYQGNLYKFIAAHAGDWDTGNVELTTITNELTNMNEKINLGATKEELNSYQNFVEKNLNDIEIIPFIKGNFISTDSTNNYRQPTDLTGDSAWQCATVSCKEGDSFTIAGDTTNSNKYHRLWMFLDSNYYILDKADIGIKVENKIIEAPENAAYFIYNSLINDKCFLCKNKSILSRLAILENHDSTAMYNNGIITSSQDIYNLETGVYRKNTQNTPINWPEAFPDGLPSTSGMVIAFKGANTYRILFHFPYTSKSRPNSAIFYNIRQGLDWVGWKAIGGDSVGENNLDINNIIKEYQNEQNKFDTSFSFTFTLSRNPMILGINGYYTGVNAPTMTYAISVTGGTAKFTSPAYTVGDSVQFVCHEWRIPPIVENYYKTCKVTITIPENTVLDIKDAYIRNDQPNQYRNDGIKFNAHCGFIKLHTKDTMASYQLASKLGFTGLITIPKFTSDGVGVCFHDDGSIYKLLQHVDGTSIASDSQENTAISQKTYNDIIQLYDIKADTSIYGHIKVPKLEDYFRFCAKCNLNPVLSIHPPAMFYGETGRINWEAIKEMTDRYGITNRLWIKSGNPSVQGRALSVFGPTFAGMILIHGVISGNGTIGEDEEYIEDPEWWDSLWQAKRITRLLPNTDESVTTVKDAVVPLVTEIYDVNATEERIKTAINEGFIVSIAAKTGKISGPDMKQFIEWGATEFTQDYHCSMGLDW